MSYPLCRFAASPKGDDAVAARRLLLGVSGLVSLVWAVLCVGLAR